jgi:hypothetical protein
MATAALPIRRKTLRRDAWWIEPALLFSLFTVFVIYSFFAGIANADYFADPYLSPFYSPCLSANCVHLTFGVPVIGTWWSFAPAILVVGFPLAFRVTCYYYRKAYYRAFFWSPAACTVPDARASYRGETRFPFVVQNIHRYSWYAALVFVVILSYDAILAYRFPTASGHAFGIGLGSLLMTVNVALIALYTFSCHACRYLLGGHHDRFHGRPIAYRLFTAISWLNGSHGNYAILSLLSVGLTDLYIRLLALGWITDPRIVFGG